MSGVRSQKREERREKGEERREKREERGERREERRERMKYVVYAHHMDYIPKNSEYNLIIFLLLVRGGGRGYRDSGRQMHQEEVEQGRSHGSNET